MKKLAPTVRYRSAKTGRFVSRAFAQRHRATTVSERRGADPQLVKRAIETLESAHRGADGMLIQEKPTC